MTSEQELFRAYRRGRRWSAPCMCGAQIGVANVRDEERLMGAIDKHYKSTVHQAYLAWQVALVKVK